MYNPRSLIRTVTVPVAPGREYTRHTYATDDAVAETQTAKYFNDASNSLKKNDLIDVMSDHKGAGTTLTLKVTDVVPNGDVTVANVTA